MKMSVFYAIFAEIKKKNMAKRGKSYSNFKQEDLQELGIQLIEENLFSAPPALVKASDWLRLTLKNNLQMPVTTEKAKSELIVSPILVESMNNNPGFFTCFSGVTFDVDKSIGLKGRSDFILARKPKLLLLEAPIFSIIEAKNDGIEDAYPQCISQLYAAEIFNNKHNTPFPFLFGAVTTGFLWKFIRYENKIAKVDSDMFYMENLDELLGILQLIINQYK
jgi:hypothetical protein